LPKPRSCERRAARPAARPAGRIKDITLTAGIRTTYASPLYKDYVPTEDAEVVRRLKSAGAIVLGKTNTPEFAAGAIPPMRCSARPAIRGIRVKSRGIVRRLGGRR
jgi:hypothetical protein